MNVPEAAFHSRAVLSVVAEAVSGDRLQRVREHLPDDWADLFDFSFVG